MPICPDPNSHRLNAEDAYFEGRPTPEVLTQDQDWEIQVIADFEELNCEGTH